MVTVALLVLNIKAYMMFKKPNAYLDPYFLKLLALIEGV